MIIKSHLLNHVSISRLSREFGVSRKAIYKWISNFADGKMPAKRGEGTSNVKPTIGGTIVLPRDHVLIGLWSFFSFATATFFKSDG